MKIGIDCRLWNETGVGRYIRNLVKNLEIIDKTNYYTVFALSEEYENLKSEIRNPKFEIRKTDIRWHTPEEQLKFPSLINRENLDLVHFPYISVPFFYNKPFVVTIHDLIPYHFPTGEASTLPFLLYKLKFLGYKLVISEAAKKAKKIIAVSEATKQEIVEHLKVDPTKVMVTYEGVDDKIRNPNIEIRNNLKNTKYFLYVGNAYPHKNLDRLLEAFSLICHPERSEGSRDIRLIFVGREDYFYKKLKEKVKSLDMEKSAVFLGEVSNEELGSLYKNALALVLPSLMEGFGLPALEGMAHGCLVISSDIPALQEVCGDAGIYFDPYNVEDIFKKMETILLNDSNHFIQNIKRGFDRAKKFSWEKMAKETLKIYESCVGL